MSHLGVGLRSDDALVSLPMRPPKPSSVSWLQALFVLRQDLRRLGNKHANLAWLAIGMDVPECELAQQFIRRRKAMA